MNWQNIPKFPQIGYRITVSWDMLDMTLGRFIDDHRLNMNPDFQRGHVWTEKQQIEYVEFALKEPESGLEIYFNHPGWMSTFKGDFVLVDGKQRLEAARRFLHNEIPAFGYYRKDIGGLEPDDIPMNVKFFFNVAKSQTRADVLKWYLDFNAGGTPHSLAEIEKVRELLRKEI